MTSGIELGIEYLINTIHKNYIQDFGVGALLEFGNKTVIYSKININFLSLSGRF